MNTMETDGKKLTLFGLAWPIFIETALFMLLGIVDVFVLSQYNDLAAGAVNAANQATSIATVVFTVVSTASAVLISQYLGAKRRQDASKIAALSIALNFITGLLVSALFVFFHRPILGFIGAKGEILSLSGQYLYADRYGGDNPQPRYDDDIDVCDRRYEHHQHRA